MVPRIIRAYEKDSEGSDIVARWHQSNKSKNKQHDTTTTTSVNMPTIQRSGFSVPRTDTNFEKKIGVDEIPEIPGVCPLRHDWGKPLLPDWEITEIPWEMQRMHSWYMRACALGLRGIQARYPVDVFGPPIIPQAIDVSFDFQDLHDVFLLNMLDVQLIRLWCM